MREQDQTKGIAPEAASEQGRATLSFTGSVSWYGVGKLMPALLTLVAVPVWLRLYGAAEYGAYSVTWVAAILVTSLTTGWLRQAILRFSGAKTHDLGSIPSAMWCAPTVLCGLLVGAVAALQVAQDQVSSAAPYVLLAAAFAVANTLYAITTALAQRYGEAFRFSLAEICRVVVAIVVTVALGGIWDSDGAAQILLGYLTGTLVALGLTYRLGRLRLGAPGSPAVAAEFWSYGWPLGLWIAISSGMLYGDRLVLSAFRSADEVGHYAAVADILIRGMGVVTFPVIVAVHPVVMSRWNSGYRMEAFALARQWARRLAVALIAVVGLSVWLGPGMLTLVVGAQDVDRILVALLAVAGGAWQLALMVHKPLELRRSTRLMLVLIVGCLGLSLVVQVMAAPMLGARGVAVGLALGAVCYCGAAWWLGRDEPERPVQRDLQELA